VTLTVLRGSATEPHTVELVRETPPAEATAARLAAPGIGLLRVAAFEGEIAAAVTPQIEELRKRGAQRLIIDVRGTARGPVENGIALARLFVASGTLAHREARDQTAEPIPAGEGDGAVTLPVVVMVSAGTAGAAEVFASALAENDRAELIGEPTIGRAGQQKLVKLSDGSGLLLTWSRYLTAERKPIHGEGLEPAVRVDEPDVEFGEAPPAEDPILEKALEVSGVQKAAA
jgi:carboxyl-terminal processing protease